MTATSTSDTSTRRSVSRGVFIGKTEAYLARDVGRTPTPPRFVEPHPSHESHALIILLSSHSPWRHSDVADGVYSSNPFGGGAPMRRRHGSNVGNARGTPCRNASPWSLH